MALLDALGVHDCQCGECRNAPRNASANLPATPQSADSEERRFREQLSLNQMKRKLAPSPKHDTTDASGDRRDRGYRVMCLDGGGIRGLLLVQVPQY